MSGYERRMVESLERAVQAVDHLEAIIGAVQEQASGVDAPPEVPNVSNERVTRGVPEDFITGCRTAIQATLDALSSIDRRVSRLPPRKPPEWWRNLAMLMAHERGKYAASHPALVDAVDVLDRHVREEGSRLALLPFLVDRLELKIVRSGSAYGFRSDSEPYPYHVSFAFNPEIDDEVDQPLRKLIGEAATFPENCVRLLRAALGEARDIVVH